MPGSITLPQVVLDLEEDDRKRYEALQPPKSIVVRYGYMRMVAELPYDGVEKPGCGSKMVLRTPRGIEIGEMLTTTCGNAGCGKSVSRKEMLSYIENSGGKNYPFGTEGKVLRVAKPEDLQEQSRLDSRKREMIKFTKTIVAEIDLPMKLVDIELLLGGERIIFHYTSEQWVDFRELVRRLAQEYQTRIEMHQVNARDEARIVADYEKCGQHCCCRQFLKVLKPVSMRSAKVQKATLDPTKISGRCGRLMCCLRYEDETYESLRKKLPHRQSRVMTDDGPGTVLDTQILTQLVLIKLDNQEAPLAFPMENITLLPRDQDPMFQQRGAARGPEAPGSPSRPPPPAMRSPSAPPPPRPPMAEPRRPEPGAPLDEEEIESADDALDQEESEAPDPETGGTPAPSDGAPTKPPPDLAQGPVQPGESGQPQGSGKRRRRRRRRRRGRGGPEGGPGGGSGPQSGPLGPPPSPPR